MKHIITSILLAACSAQAIDDVAAVPPTQLTQPGEVIGKWCTDGMCLEATPTSFGPGWVMYNWRAPDCQEGGFLTLDAQQRLAFGAAFPYRGCWSRIDQSVPYYGTFTLDQDERLTVQLSVWPDPLVLSAE